MMLGMINASGICAIGNSTRACAAAMATLQLADEALIETQRMMVAANMGTVR